MSDTRSHWDNVYTLKQPSEVSWYQPHLRVSFDLIVRAGVSRTDQIIDVGGGGSTLVDDLLDHDFQNITVLDISSKAIDISRARLGTRAALVNWVTDDVVHAALEHGRYRLWHDRAVLHFLTGENDRRAYIRQLRHAVRAGGSAIISTFSTEGPEKCSGLTVRRYSPETLIAELGAGFRLTESRLENHTTPSGTVQSFLYCLFSISG